MRRIAMAVIAILVVVAPLYPQCAVPKYRVWVTVHNPGFVFLHVSISVPDFAPKRLLCLVGVLKQRYGDSKSILYEFFSDPKVASQVVILTRNDPSPEMVRRTTFMHAVYNFDHERGGRLYINPDPLQDGENSTTQTRIDLPVADTPACKIQLNGRCMLVLPTIYPFPSVRDVDHDRGSLTLAGRVAPNGRIGRIRVAESHLSPGESGEFIKRVAIRHLKGWRFEAATHTDAIRITYEFRYSLPGHGARTWQMPVHMEQLDKTVTNMNLSVLAPPMRLVRN